MTEKVKFFMSFRVRLMLLLTAFLLLTMVLVLGLDKWAQRRAAEEVSRQSEQVKDAVNEGFRDFEKAIAMAIENLNSERFLYRQIQEGEIELPKTVEHIIVADEHGAVSDTTLEDLKGKSISVPEIEVAQESPGDPVVGEVEIHGSSSKTYDIPFTSAKGLYWSVIVTNPQSITNKIEDASQTLATRSRELSNVRLIATTGLLMLALAIAVIIGWSFTRPIQRLAWAARRVAAGDLDFQVQVERRDEVGQLAGTFNEMIAGLKSKRELEEKLNNAERQAAIGRLTQAVAHEIRNPLNVINLSIDHVVTKYAPKDEARREQLTRVLSSVRDEVARLKRLVNDLLNYGRPTRMAVENIDIRALMAETIALIRPQAEDQGVEVTLEDEKSPVEVLGDRERLKSCFSNIAINALQAMPGGGHFSARVARLDGGVEVTMSDTGAGISEEALGKIFEPYFSTKQAGFGLGLAVTKAIVDEHRGSIEVKSRLNEGTTFTVKLPASDQGKVS
jgi:nitrogen fixation/metabolism regulation signal transduction histidine kinase